MWNEADRRSILMRLELLSPEIKPAWGRMSAPQMQVHVADQIRCALGQLDLGQKYTWMRRSPFKQLIVHLLPWPKNTPTAPELVDPAAGDWEQDRSELLRVMEEFVRRGPKGTFSDHPMFGTLRAKDWGVLVWRHLDHHFRQFGI